MESLQKRAVSLIRELIPIYMSDRILMFAIIVVSILTVGNIFNKFYLEFEPLQYSFFSYDKILHFLASIIIVRILYRLLLYLEHDRIKQPRLIASILTLVLYGLIWEPFELLTFLMQESRRAQFWF